MEFEGDESKGTLKRYEKLWIKVRDLQKLIS